jgi:thioredoxin 1
MIELTDSTFDEYIASAEKPVIVDFWASWCQPCLRMTPDLAILDAEIPVVKVDVDAYPELARRYGVQSMPTLVVFQDGEAVGSSVGAKPLTSLREIFKQYI